MSRPADKHDVDAIADLIAVSVASARISGGSYTYEDVQRRNIDEGWTYELVGPQRRNVECVESMRPNEEQLSAAWLTANRRVDNDTERYV
jgi:hypothetical protein